MRLREEAEVEASRRRSDAASDAEAELAMAKQQGREMVNEARAYRERVLSELARRRELAREQIEQLMHGRDRLMQAFERARVVAVDVVAELKPLGEPNEYVNLSPTTGPVPVMLPNTRRPDERLEYVEPMDVADATNRPRSTMRSGGSTVVDDERRVGDRRPAESEDDRRRPSTIRATGDRAETGGRRQVGDAPYDEAAEAIDVEEVVEVVEPDRRVEADELPTGACRTRDAPTTVTMSSSTCSPGCAPKRHRRCRSSLMPDSMTTRSDTAERARRADDVTSEPDASAHR